MYIAATCIKIAFIDNSLNWNIQVIFCTPIIVNIVRLNINRT